MGELAVPTEEERAERVHLAQEILTAIVNDEEPPNPINLLFKSKFHSTLSEEVFVIIFSLAQEVIMLMEEKYGEH